MERCATLIVEIYQSFLGTPFGLKLKVHDVDQFLINMAKGKLKPSSFTNLSLARCTLIVNHVLTLSLWYFIAVWVGSRKNLGKIKALLHNYL